jgi:hypothetical protein
MKLEIKVTGPTGSGTGFTIIKILDFLKNSDEFQLANLKEWGDDGYHNESVECDILCLLGNEKDNKS